MLVCEAMASMMLTTSLISRLLACSTSMRACSLFIEAIERVVLASIECTRGSDSLTSVAQLSSVARNWSRLA